MSNAKNKALQHLVSARDTGPELRKERKYWNARYGKKNLRVTSEKSSEAGHYTQRYHVKKDAEPRGKAGARMLKHLGLSN